MCQRGCPAPSRDTWAAEGAMVSFALVSCAYRHQGEGDLRGTHLEQNAGVAFRHRGRPDACRGLCLASRRRRLPLLGWRSFQHRQALQLARHFYALHHPLLSCGRSHAAWPRAEPSVHTGGKKRDWNWRTCRGGRHRRRNMRPHKPVDKRNCLRAPFGAHSGGARPGVSGGLLRLGMHPRHHIAWHWDWPFCSHAWAPL